MVEQKRLPCQKLQVFTLKSSDKSSAPVEGIPMGPLPLYLYIRSKIRLLK